MSHFYFHHLHQVNVALFSIIEFLDALFQVSLFFERYLDFIKRAVYKHFYKVDQLVDV